MGKLRSLPAVVTSPVLVVGFGEPARANERWFNASADAHVQDGTLDTNHDSDHLDAGDGFDDGSLARSHFEWDISTLAGEIIDEVVLELHGAEKGTTLGVGAHDDPVFAFEQHGQCVSGVVHEATRARDDGLIDQDERARLVREAAHAN